MAEKNYDLKINVLSSDYNNIPEKKNYSNIWFNLYGIKEANQELVKFMGEICQGNTESKKLLINANEKIKEQLTIFCEVHGAQFVK